jgi:hypothetical protein
MTSLIPTRPSLDRHGTGMRTFNSELVVKIQAPTSPTPQTVDNARKPVMVFIKNNLTHSAHTAQNNGQYVIEHNGFTATMKGNPFTDNNAISINGPNDPKAREAFKDKLYKVVHGEGHITYVVDGRALTARDMITAPKHTNAKIAAFEDTLLVHLNNKSFKIENKSLPQNQHTTPSSPRSPKM